MLLTQATVLTPGGFARADVRVSGGRFAAVAPSLAPEAGEQAVALAGRLVVPGFVNIHTHGAAGADTMDATYEAFDAMSRFHASRGTTTYLPSTCTMPAPAIHAALSAAAGAAERGVSGARIGGVNLEGPYLSAEKRGAHDPAQLRTPREVDFAALQSAAQGHIRLVTVAPELDGAMEFIRAAAPRVTVSLGHSAAPFGLCMEAFQAGARHVTHLFNAMNPLLHRDPGLVGAAYESGAVAEIICDGLHVVPTVVKMAFELFAGRACIITDSMRAAGMPDGDYTLGADPVIVSGGIARTPSGTIAGGTTGMSDCVKNLISWGVSPEAALRAASIVPARAVGLDSQVGSIEPGKAADFLVLDSSYDVLQTYVGGRLVYQAEANA